MAILKIFAVVNVTNLETARLWYERLFGRPCDRTPMPEVHEWHMAGSGVQVLHSPDKAGSGYLTLFVDDLETQRQALASAGLQLGPVTSSDVAATAQIQDPDGNTVTFVKSAD